MDSNETFDEATTTLRKRGPKTRASITALKVVPDAKMRPPEPPTDLTPTERAIWDGIVEKCRGGWFYASEALLASYVRMVAQEAELAREIAAAEPGSRRRFEVLKLMISVAKAAANIATKLRLSPRSSVDRYVKKVAPSGPKPWDDDLA